MSAEGYVAFNDRPLSSHRRMLDLVPAGGRALDAGCSSGYLAERLVQRGFEVVGLELDADAGQAAERWCTQVIVGDVERMEIPLEAESFDLVLCGDIVEHLRDPGAALAKLRPLLKPGGRLVLSTPNVANWAIRLSLLFGRFRYTERGILDRTHAHFFTRSTLRETIERSGYRIETLDHVVPVPLVRATPVDRLAHAIGSLRPSLFAYQFVVAATPAS